MLPMAMGASANLSIYQFCNRIPYCLGLFILLFDYKEEQSSLAFNHIFNTNSQPDEMIQ